MKNVREENQVHSLASLMRESQNRSKESLFDEARQELLNNTAPIKKGKLSK